MLGNTEKSFSETFIVWNDEINLVGALIPLLNGRATICGTIKFKNGKNLSISSPPDDCKILHKRLLYACRCIAKFYGTNVIYRRRRMPGSLDEPSALFRREHPLYN